LEAELPQQACIPGKARSLFSDALEAAVEVADAAPDWFTT